MSSFSIMTSPRLMPIRCTMVGWNAFSSGIEAPERCTESAQFTASTRLPNSTMAPSPISLTMRGAMKNTPLSIGNGSGLNTSAVTRGKCGPGQRLVLDADAVGEQRCIGERKYKREQRQSESQRNHRDLKNDNHIVRMPQPAVGPARNRARAWQYDHAGGPALAEARDHPQPARLHQNEDSKPERIDRMGVDAQPQD